MVVVHKKPLEPDQITVKIKPNTEPEKVIRESLQKSQRFVEVKQSSILPHFASIDDSLQHLNTAIQTLDAALIKHCLEHLIANLTTLENIVHIYKHVEPLLKQPPPPSASSTPADNNNCQPSAPPMHHVLNNCPADDDTTDVEKRHVIIQDTLSQFIDLSVLGKLDARATELLTPQHGEEHLLVDLSYSQMTRLLFRDSLNVSGELLVYGAVIRWGNAACKRQGRINLSEVLRELKYAPRYGLLTRKEYQRGKIEGGLVGPKKMRILEAHESRDVEFFIEEKKRFRPVGILPKKMSQPRTGGEEVGGRQRRESEASGDRSGKDKCIIYFLVCWTALFD